MIYASNNNTGSYSIRMSRGHGLELNANVVLAGAPKLLRRWPRAYVIGSQVALDMCVEQGLDVTPHTECEPAKKWRYSASNGSLVHGSGLCLEGRANQAVLAACAPSPAQKWTFSDKGLAAGTTYLGGPPQASASNYSTMWPRLRVPLQMMASSGWQWHYSAAEGIVKLLNSPPLTEEAGSKDMRLCLTAQSNTASL